MNDFFYDDRRGPRCGTGQCREPECDFFEQGRPERAYPPCYCRREPPERSCCCPGAVAVAAILAIACLCGR